MNVQETLQNNLTAIISDARYAPSVHNTQPWQVQTRENAIAVSINPSHELHDGDPTGRETLISMGIFCEAIVIASKRFGLDASSVDVHDKLAKISFEQAATADPTADHQIELLKRRCTDRSIFKPVAIPEKLGTELDALAPSSEVSVHMVTDHNSIDTIASLTSKGIRLALSSPGFRRELSQYLTVPWSRFRRGISTASLAIAWPIAVLQPFFMRLGWQTGAEAALEKRRWQSASGVVVITAAGDMAPYWFETGRVYLRVSLRLEAAGLSQATSAAIVEASNYHDDIEDMLGTNQRVLAMIRIGKGSKARHYSPRVEASELITSN